MVRTLTAAALATSVLAFSAPAQAQGSAQPMGLRFELGWAGQSTLGNLGSVNVPGGDFASFPSISPTGDIKVGYDFGQFTPLIGLSLATTTVSPDDDTSFTNTAFIIDLEGRYYFNPHRKGLNPFVWGEFAHAFTSLGTDPEPEGPAEDLLEDLESTLDFTSINVGFGLEYKFDQSAFAIGGKWGAGITWAGFDAGEAEVGNTTIGTVGHIYAAWRL